MKKFCITFLTICILVLGLAGVYLKSTPEKTEYLRIHIRANSNLDCDQEVKLLVKDVIVNYLTPYVARIDTTEEAYYLIENKLLDLERLANATLKENGFNYTSKAKLASEKFPTRTYKDLTLKTGYYDALILELGEAEGDNWWCVIYPPLCFTGEGVNYQYKSKILEIIKRFYERKDKEGK